MRKLLIIIGSVLAVAVVGLLMFTLLAPQDSVKSNPDANNPSPSSSPTEEPNRAPATIEETVAALLESEPDVLAKLDKVSESCNKDVGLSAKAAGPFTVETTYEEFVKKAYELAGKDKNFTVTENSGSELAKDKNISIVYQNRSTITLNFMEGQLSITQIKTC